MKSAKEVAHEFRMEHLLHNDYRIEEPLCVMLLAFAAECVKEAKTQLAEAAAEFCWDPKNRETLLSLAGCERSDYLKMARAQALEEAAKIAGDSADYYSKNMKREDGTFITTAGAAAQTSNDIANAIRALKDAIWQKKPGVHDYEALLKKLDGL